MAASVGKVLIVVGLCLQAYLLLTDKPTIQTFQKELASTISHLKFITPEMSSFLHRYLHAVIAACFFSSIMILVSRSTLSKLIVLVGFLLLLVGKYDIFHKIPAYKERSFWQLLALIGGVIYLMGI